MDPRRGFKRLVDRAPLGIYRTTPAGEHLYANEVLLEMAGYTSLEELARENLEQEFPVDYSRAEFRATLAQHGRIDAREAMLRRRDGTLIAVREWARVVRRADNSVAWYEGVVENISAQRQAERERDISKQRLWRVVDNMTDALMVDNVAGDIVYANRRFLELFGVEESELATMSLEDYVAPEWRARLRERHEQRVRGEQVPSNFEYVGVRGDGVRRDLEVTVVPVVEDGTLIGTQSVIRDVTERKVVERQHAQARKMEALGQLAGGVAHDFNNILMAIIGYPDLIEAKLGRQHAAVDELLEIRKAAERAMLLTRQLLSFSRKQVVQMQVLDLGVTSAELLPMLRRLIHENIELNLDAAPECVVFADASDLEQIVLNLVVNARDAIDGNGSIDIKIRAERPSPNADRPGVPQLDFIRLDVADTGGGMSPETRAKVFEPFFTTKALGAGTGLGLATVYAAIQRLGGRIEVASELGKGTCVSLWIPRRERSPSQALALRPQPSYSLERRERVLLVEDDAVARAVLLATLTSLGCAVIEAHDGAQALKVVADASVEFDLVLSDLVMPGASGPEVVRFVKSQRPNTAVILMSGYAEGDLPEQTERLNVEFIEKPFTREELARAMSRVMAAQALSSAGV